MTANITQKNSLKGALIRYREKALQSCSSKKTQTFQYSKPEKHLDFKCWAFLGEF